MHNILYDTFDSRKNNRCYLSKSLEETDSYYMPTYRDNSLHVLNPVGCECGNVLSWGNVIQLKLVENGNLQGDANSVSYVQLSSVQFNIVKFGFLIVCYRWNKLWR